MDRSPDRTAEVAALFDGARLTLARHLAGLRKSDLASLVEQERDRRGGLGVGREATNRRRPSPSWP